ncbi:YbaY family lipoprotein [Streptomyces sp. NPDC052236]|uniref:YbaY family lipoprotein n=1 Tax=Streptomyces sp. NPDC052236 TaxID=3365686 RepID=UPI0037D186AC
MRVAGTVRIPPTARNVGAATLRVRLQDVSTADAPATVLGEFQTEVRGTVEEMASIPFSIDADIPEDWQGCLDVSAHVDRVGDGAIHAGDLLSTASHPVSSRGQIGVVVEVQVVR